MASQTDIMNRALRIANAAGLEPHSSPVIDNAFLAEDFFAIALRQAVIEQAKTPGGRAQQKRTYPLTLVAGEIALPDTVLDEYLFDSTCFVSGDTTLLASYEPRYEDYLRAQFMYPQIAYYSTRGSTLCFRGPNQAAGAATSTISLTTPGVPDIPATITDAISAGSDVVEQTILILAAMIRGKMAEDGANA